tara:strand:+ start:1195 stop:1446 length:252 start_codon:yes stop_codon:yes gene_type:complete
MEKNNMANWATPTVCDSYQRERSLDKAIERANGVRKGRKAPGTLTEQVCFPWTQQVYSLVSAYNKENSKEDIYEYVKRRLNVN